MISSRILVNPTAMSSSALRTQYIKPAEQKDVEASNVYSKANNEVTKKAMQPRILPVNNVNVMYVASAFRGATVEERPLKSLWA